MKQLAIAIGLWAYALLCRLWQKILTWHGWYREKVHHVSREHKLELKRLSNQKIKGLSAYWHWTDVSHTIYAMLWGLFLFALGAGIYESIRDPKLFEEYLVLLIFPGIMLGMTRLCQPDNARRSLRDIFKVIGDHPEIRLARKQYRYFYIPHCGNIVFSNVRPFWLLCAFPREKTAPDWAQYRNDPVREWMDWLIMSTIYLRFVWPFILSPVQLAPLAYRTAKKKVAFREGQRVLMIGAGPLPYHCWWKRKLGETGSIVALDIDPYVNRTSRSVERAFEWLRGLIWKRRWVSDHVVGDAEKLPFADGSFDVVVAIRCYHVNVREGLRVLKPGGKLLIDDFSQTVHLDPKTQNVDESLWSWHLVTA